MRRIFLPLLLVLLAASAQASNDLVVTARWHVMTSEVMGEGRSYAVYLPPSYSDEAQRFPVIYVLDGDETRLRGMSGLVESLSTENLEKQIPECIIVAIPNTDRVRDLTPTNTLYFFRDQQSDELASSGGAARFLDFLAEELIPHVDAAYRTTDTRVLVGESYGGLFAADAFLRGQGMFSHYLITDATYIWDNNYLNRRLVQQQSAGVRLKGALYLSFANNAAFGEMGATNLGWGRDFASALELQQDESVLVRQQYFGGESHGTVAQLSWYYGLRFLLGGGGKGK
jgi:predicted alpha/beta superfamily hydrolase